MDPAANLTAIQMRIEAACARANRDPAAVTLLPVSKSQPPDAVRAIAGLGWHMIGHLQTNKCRDAVELFDMIQSVDSLRLAQEINKRAEQAAKRMPLLLEVNVTGETSKFGYQPERLLSELQQINALKRIEIQGLMTIAPWTLEPEKVRPFFRRLRELKEQCEQILGAPLPHLSMGMSGDFEVAIEEKATLVRIGTALFGRRPPANTTKAAEKTA